MRLNFVSDAGDGFGFAFRCVAEGTRDVRMWIREKDAKTIGDGLVPKVGDIEDLLVDANPSTDIFIFDSSGNGVLADGITARGFATLGGSMLADRLERDRAFGNSIMDRCAIETPETRSFRDFEKAIAFVEANADRRWVYKPSKHLGEIAPSHVSSDSEELVETLKNIASETKIEKPEFELQEFVDGVALSTEFWFQHGEWIESLTNHTVERKALMNDDLGPSGGCVGNLVWLCPGCKICQSANQLVQWANDQRYHGMLDLNAIVAKRHIYGLEFTPRFGYDAAPTLLFELVRGKISEFFVSMARGSLGELELREGFAGGVGVTIPPWPYEKQALAEADVPIRGLEPNEAYWYNVKASPEGSDLVTAGAWGNIAIVTAHSSNSRNAVTKAYAFLESLRLKDKQYRTDLHEVFEEDLDKLSSMGVALATYAAQ
jgi:phosphoribosylamine-glycine ligase